MDNAPKPRNIIIGQNVSDDKVEFAKAQRREMSPVERELWRRIRSNQLDGYHFRRQQVIGAYIADFYCHSVGLAIEVDGDTHDQDYDNARDKVFAQKGIRTLRFSNHQVLHEIDGILEMILQNLRETSP